VFIFSRYNKKHYKIIKEIAEETGIDIRVVNLIASHPSIYTSRIMSDKENYRPIRWRYLGVWSIMKGKEKE